MAVGVRWCRVTPGLPKAGLSSGLHPILYAPKARITVAVTVSHPRHNDALNVPKDAVPAVRLLTGSLRQLRSQVARPHVWSHPPLLHCAQVLADVIHHLFSCEEGREAGFMCPQWAWPMHASPLRVSQETGEGGDDSWLRCAGSDAPISLIFGM